MPKPTMTKTELLFVIDFDGTVAPLDTVDELLERFAGTEWQCLEQQWIRGEIGSQQCMAGQIALVRGNGEVLKEFLEAVQIDSSFAAFVEYVRPFAEVIVVSDGLDYPIKHALRKANVDVPVFANALSFRENGLGISFPYAESGCSVQSGACKCAIRRRVDARRDLPVVLVGDGKSDQCIARAADYVFAKAKLRAICESEGIPHTPFETFEDVLAVVRGWISTNAELERTWPLTASQQ